ncbi:hemolysin D [Cypionkella aquatica]|uniref:Hemolysin D n=1 Tax=Cypionkella aquatica TaxID=1756042 RepID=A0AA37X029_9RHOB|nr:efflux RND transporter periplasmic adaptor subunit [Cypionkella aquatica]GLS87378.1 hemolysin D [Cypionkella aquatica]GLS88564.1 hemolysin D [Cypionkella aquatica]
MFMSKVIAVFLALQSVAVGVAFAEGAEPAKDAAATQVLPAITVSKVETRHLRDVVLASGLVAPQETIQVAPLIEGQPIEALLADIGDRVTAGQVLARLSTSTLTLQKAQLAASLAAAKAQIAQAEAQNIEAQSSADEAKRTSDRTTKLKAQGSASQAAADTALAGAVSAQARVLVAVQSLEAAKAQQALVEAQLANVDLQLSRTEVTAPFAGEITARNAQLGAIASAAGQPMFTLIRDGALELRADVAEADLTRLMAGQTATLNLVGLSKPLSGKISLVEPSIDAVTRLGRVRIAIDDASAVRPGMYVEASILVHEGDSPAVPITAVKSSGAESSVMLVQAGVVSQRLITTGVRDGGWIEVLDGLQLGDDLVTKAGAFVREGDHINPVAAVAAETN